jgi:hypothetical protein
VCKKTLSNRSPLLLCLEIMNYKILMVNYINQVLIESMRIKATPVNLPPPPNQKRTMSPTHFLIYITCNETRHTGTKYCTGFSRCHIYTFQEGITVGF